MQENKMTLSKELGGTRFILASFLLLSVTGLVYIEKVDPSTYSYVCSLVFGGYAAQRLADKKLTNKGD